MGRKRPVCVGRRRYKVLPLPGWMRLRPGWEFMREETMARYAEVPPVFRRPGWYFDRQTGEAWLEAYGLAWRDAGGRKWFQYNLDHNPGNNRMHPDVFAAVAVVMRAGLADHRLVALWRVEEQMRMLRAVTVESRKGAYQILGRIRGERVRGKAKP